MIGSLIRWSALGTVVLLVRAIVREARENRSPVILLPAAERRAADGAPRRTRRRREQRAAAEEPDTELDTDGAMPEETTPADAPPVRDN